MRILILTNHYPPSSLGSYELQCLQTTQGLIERGHKVRVLCGKDQTGQRSAEIANLVFSRLKFYPEDDAPSSRFFSLFKINQANTRELEKQILEFHPEVIMVWGMSGLPRSLLMEGQRHGIPIVYVVYDHWLAEAEESDPWCNYWQRDNMSEPPILRNLLQRLHLEKRIHARAPFGHIREISFANVCFCSESLRKETTKRSGLPFDHAKIIPCSIIPSEIHHRTGETLSPRRLLYVARLSEKKDPFTALKAILELRRRGRDEFTIDLYGRSEGNYESKLHEYVRRYHLGGSVSFKPLNEELVRNNIHLYDFLVFTSKYPEPFPLVHLKAMAARVPVITTLEGGSSELIRDGENGVAFRTSDASDLADKIVSLSEDLERRQRITEAAYREAVEKYALKSVIRRFETVLHEAVEEKTRTPVVA